MPADKALVNYIRDALASGAGAQQIRDTLKTQDWPDAAIADAMVEARRPLPAAGRPIASRAPGMPPAAPLNQAQPAPAEPARSSAPLGFALALAGGTASLARILSTVIASAPNPLLGGLASVAVPIGILFSILILLSGLLLRRGKFHAGGALAMALSLVLALFAADPTMQLPALLGVVGGALGLAKQ